MARIVPPLCTQWSYKLKQLCRGHYYDLTNITSRCHHRMPTTINRYGSLRTFAYGSPDNIESPYDVLQVKANASKEEIKMAFRTLAKLHHPDLNSHLFSEDSNDNIIDDNNTMTKIVNAYETLMEKYSASYLSSATDSRVALACEIYTIEELKSSPVFDVYTFRIFYSEHDSENAECNYNYDEIEKPFDDQNHNHHHQLDPHPVIPITAHPQDSISDLKRYIQSKYAAAWGLVDRRRDRDGLYLGWELVCRKNDGDVNSVLSYHLFLDSYGINDGDILHSIVRSNMY